MPFGLSRRSFLQGSAVSSVGMGMIAQGSAADSAPSRADGALVVGPAAVPITLTVNGVARALHVEPRTTLAEALRGPLDLTGTKIACNRGACSACTVWLDGVTVCSCMMLAIEVGARKVTTIEGLARGDTLHAVQAAFIEHDAMQCGLCTPGMALSCAVTGGTWETPVKLRPEDCHEPLRPALTGSATVQATTGMSVM